MKTYKKFFETINEAKKEIVTYTQNGKTKTEKFNKTLGKDGSMEFAKQMSKKGFKPITITDRDGLTWNYRGPGRNEREEVRFKANLQKLANITEVRMSNYEILDNGQPLRRKFASFEEAMDWGKMLGAKTLIKVDNYGVPIGKKIWNPMTGKFKNR